MLVLASAFLHALWNALIKRERDVRAATFAVLTVAVILSALASLLRRSWFPTGAALSCAIAAGVCEAGYFATLSRSLEAGPLGQYYPVSRGGALFIIWPVSMLWFGERATPASFLGALLVAAGLFAVGLPYRGLANGGWRDRGLSWAIVSAVFIAGYNLLYKGALGLGSDPATLFATSVAIALALNLATMGSRRANIAALLSQRPVPMVLAGALCCLSFWLFLFGLERAGAGAMVTLRNTSVMFAQLFSWRLGERPTVARVGGAGAIAAGAMLLAA